ncbi:MAG: hypothetical protein HW373_41 [Deltaproteobacteria bacterium]|nr:hypothetical protein [Deltaproteobacteria bacterium]
MNHKEILQELRRLCELTQIHFTPLLPDSGFKSAYAPINTYLGQLQKGTKPETAAEGLFRPLAEIFLNAPALPQVGLGSGFVDFKLDAKEESSIVLELKPLFHLYDAELLKSFPLKPTEHRDQVEKYLRHSEYLVLTDLRDAYLYSARDVWQPLKPFAKLPFAELLERTLAKQSLLDVIRDEEDGEVRPELDRSFFEQLQDWFRAFVPVRFTDEVKHDELVIQILNQLIFAKTMEDHSLVRYRHLQDEFERAKEKWRAKGAHRIVWQFLKDFEEFFEDYYDTELFERSIWKELDREPKNLERFARLLEAVLGVDEWSKTFQRGIVHYNYRLINEDIFGKSYEMFLAANRKDEGIFYTPATITVPMADSLVEGLFGPPVTQVCDAVSAGKADFTAADALMLRLTRLAIGDTAGGSGGFLIKILRAVWQQYQRIDQASLWVKNWQNGGDLLNTPPNVQQARAFRERWNFDNRRVRVAQIMLRHIFAVDKDAGAIEVAKTNLWKEAVKLSTEDYNFRRLTGDINRTLPSLRLNFICADSLVDTDSAEQVRYLTEVCGDAMNKLCVLREQYIANPSNHAPLEEALKLHAKLRDNLTEHFQNETLPAPPLFVALSFFPAWFDRDGQASPANECGFDGIIGNPPWEGFKPIRKEFAANFYRGKPQFSKMGMDGPAFEKWFEQELKTNAEFAARWREHEEYYERHKEFFGRRFKYQGTGDWNLFKLFMERDLTLVRPGGQFSLLVPSGFQTDEGCADLRRWFMTENRLDELTSFENRGYNVIENGREKTKQIFPDVDSRFKFGFFKVVKGAATPKDHAFDARFYLHDPKDYASTPIRYAVEMIQRFSPHNGSFMEFRSPIDYTLATKIRNNHRLLEEFSYTFRRELHMTGDNRFFRKLGDKKPGKGELRLYEGKMIHQFDASFSPPTFAVEEASVREELLRKEIFRIAQFLRDQKLEKLDGKAVPEPRDELNEMVRQLFEKRRFKLQYEFERFVYREVASSTNERTIIATIIPEQVCAAHTLMYLNPYYYEVDGKGKLQQREIGAAPLRGVAALANSLTLNFYLRSKVTTHVSVFQFVELPIPELKPTARKQLAAAADKLLKNPRDVKERAALEVFIARDLYGLSREDWQHLTATFTFGSGSTKAELDEIIRQSLVLWPTSA